MEADLLERATQFMVILGMVAVHHVGTAIAAGVLRKQHDSERSLQVRGDLKAVFVRKIRIHGGRLAAASDGSMPVLLRDDDGLSGCGLARSA
ncbi:hypothetical protein SmB9_23670 [Sphingosinicella microcystinivorans]|uniref:Uncharacterized protein n=1 Tax=Sphingosinicella microcystinivorans TaxID=335406 RepID=A0AAD1G1H1_SPHMI|nr:hypothetical protein SmB9_23670 [Sphingosinicella microcystinivorans]